MNSLLSFSTGKGNGKRLSHTPPIDGTGNFPVQGAGMQFPHYAFQPLPPPNRPAPYRFDLSQLLSAQDVKRITDAGVMVFHSVGDTGDYRGQEQDFVAEMMAHDAQGLPDGKKPAFFYHLGDVVYFAGDLDRYGANFYETYKDYPAFIVAISGNHDCQPDDPQDGPVNPNKIPFDGWVQNFMSKNPAQLGSLKTNSQRTQMDLPNVYWTFTTPFATIIGLCSNVGETEGEIHPDQVKWFQDELAAVDPNRALIVTVHHPPFSGDTQHSGSTVVYKVLFDSFQQVKRYPNLILSGHVHNYQRFTNVVQGPKGQLEIPCVVAGAGGYSKLGKLHLINGAPPPKPMPLGNTLTLEDYDEDDFGFLRIEVSKNQIVGTYLSAPYVAGASAVGNVVESFTVDLVNNTVTKGGGGKGPKKPPKKPPKPPKKPKKG